MSEELKTDNGTSALGESFAKSSTEIRIQAVRYAEQRLDAQLQLMIAADERAGAIANTAVTLGVFAAGVSLTLLGTGGFSPAIIIGAAMTAIIAGIGAVFCVFASRPVSISAPGWSPKSMKYDWEKSELEFQESVLTATQQSIEENRERMNQAAKWTNKGAIFSYSAPLAGLFIGLIVFVITAQNSNGQKQSIDRFWSKFETSYVEGDPEAFLELWDVDSKQILPEVGQRDFDEISRFYSQHFSSATYTGVNVERAESTVTGDWALSTGIYTFDTPMEVEGRDYAVLLRRHENGEWKIHREITSPRESRDKVAAPESAHQ